jgi:hypothetical protein
MAIDVILSGLNNYKAKKTIMKGFSHTGVRKFSFLKKQKQRSYSFDFFSERPLSCVESDKFGLRRLIMLLRLN